jgi:EAL domain-containing protein (putative c-di-GMP-specific phosphodiesterase class I)
MTKAIQPIFDVEGIDSDRPLVRSWEVNQIICDVPSFFENNTESSEIEAMDGANIAHALDLLKSDLSLRLSVNARMGMFTEDLAQRTHALFYKNKNLLPRLTVEIVEHGFCHAGNIGRKKVSEVMSNLQQLAQLGVNLSIDDYGSGHNTAGLLLRDFWSEAKIDGQITLAAGSGCGRAAKILSGITSMMKDLGISVVYEHIESQAMLNMAVKNGAHGVQGFFVGRPQIMSIEDMLKGLFRHQNHADRYSNLLTA